MTRGRRAASQQAILDRPIRHRVPVPHHNGDPLFCGRLSVAFFTAAQECMCVIVCSPGKHVQQSRYYDSIRLCVSNAQNRAGVGKALGRVCASDDSKDVTGVRKIEDGLSARRSDQIRQVRGAVGK